MTAATSHDGWTRSGGGHVLWHDDRMVADVLWSCGGSFVPVVWLDADDATVYAAGPPTADVDAAKAWAEAECRKRGMMP